MKPRTITATGSPVRKLHYTNGAGKELSDAAVDQMFSNSPRCRHCGTVVNRSGAPKDNQQTLDEVRALIGPSVTYIQTWGGAVPIECWLEHFAWALKYVRLELRNLPHGACLVEIPYPDDRWGGAFGIWPILSKEYAL